MAAISATKRNAESAPQRTAYLGLIGPGHPSAHRKKTWLAIGGRRSFGLLLAFLVERPLQEAKNLVFVQILGVQYVS